MLVTKGVQCNVMQAKCCAYPDAENQYCNNIAECRCSTHIVSFTSVLLTQIAEGSLFPQKTKAVRHGNLKYLDELEHDPADFVQVHCSILLI